MIRNLNYTLLLVFLMPLMLAAQDSKGFYFGPKAGISFSTQQWNNYQDRQPLIAFHGDIFIETLDPEYKGSLYANVGYHTRGSATRFNDFNTGIAFSSGFRFNNLVLGVGIKKRIVGEKKFLPYYMVGIRGEYTFSTNLSQYEDLGNPFYPVNVFVNKINYGFDFGGGFELDANEFVIPYIEIKISPDLSFQYRSPNIPTGAINPYTGTSIPIPERMIRNIGLEISFGLKLKREVILVD